MAVTGQCVSLKNFVKIAKTLGRQTSAIAGLWWDDNPARRPRTPSFAQTRRCPHFADYPNLAVDKSSFCSKAPKPNELGVSSTLLMSGLA